MPRSQAVLVTDDGRKRVVYPKNDKMFTMDEVKILLDSENLEFVHGVIQYRSMRDEPTLSGMVLIIDGAARLSNSRVNQEATEILADCCDRFGESVLGTALWIDENCLDAENSNDIPV